MKKTLFILLFLFVIDLLLILSNNVFQFDNLIYNGLMAFKSDYLTTFMKLITMLANVRMIVILNILLAIIMVIFHKREFSLIPLASIMSAIVNNIIKLIIRRNRPWGIALVTEKFYSFPSGHSMISILFYGAIIYYLFKYKVKHYQIISLILAILIFIIGLSRIYLGVHYASDVIGGWLMGGILLIIITRIWEVKVCKH